MSTSTTSSDANTDNSDSRTCWLVQTGGEYQQRDREQLEITEDAAESQLDDWREELGTEDRWFDITRMKAIVDPTSEQSP